MNPNASSFTFSPGAASWTPGGAAAGAAAPPAPPAPAEEIVLGGGNGSSAVAGASGGAGDEEGEEAMDEDDPLWKAFLALACGDKAKATAMLEEPDSYMHLPEITAAMAAADAAAGAAGGEDWDADNAPIAAVGGGAAAEDAAAEPVKAVAKPAAIVKSPAKGGAADDMDEEEAFVEEVEAEEDPREHLNLGEALNPLPLRTRVCRTTAHIAAETTLAR